MDEAVAERTRHLRVDLGDHGARALGRAGELGELSPGARADLIAVPFSGTGDSIEAVTRHTGTVTASMIGGAWAIAPGG